MKTLLLVSIISLLVVTPCSYAQTKAAPAQAVKTNTAISTTDVRAPVMKAGLWEHTQLNETAGSSTRKTLVSQACYSADDAKNVIKMLPPQQELGSKCQVSNIAINGESATWKLSCAGKGFTLAGPSRMTMKSDSYSGSADLERKASGKPGKVTQTITGKWLGQCK